MENLVTLETGSAKRHPGGTLPFYGTAAGSPLQRIIFCLLCQICVLLSMVQTGGKKVFFRSFRSLGLRSSTYLAKPCYRHGFAVYGANVHANIFAHEYEKEYLPND